MLPLHYNCRCVAVPVAVELPPHVEKLLEEIAVFTPRTLGAVRNGFFKWLTMGDGTNAVNLAQYCLLLAKVDQPLPWEDGYDDAVVADMLSTWIR